MSAIRARIIGVGQGAAGDDGIGIAVARWLTSMHIPEDVEIVENAEPSSIIRQLSDGAECVVLIDAIVDGGDSGRVLQIDPTRAESSDARLLSTHGIGLLEAIEIARALDEAALARRIEIVGITIEQPTRYSGELSESVAAAIPSAAELALRLATI